MTPIVVDSPAGTGFRIGRVDGTVDLGMLPEKRRAFTVVHRRDGYKDRRGMDRHTQAEAGGRSSLGSRAKPPEKPPPGRPFSSQAKTSRSSSSSKPLTESANSPTSSAPTPTTSPTTPSSSNLQSIQSSSPFTSPPLSFTTTSTTSNGSVNSTLPVSNSGPLLSDTTGSTNSSSVTNPPSATSASSSSGGFINVPVPVTSPSSSIDPPNSSGSNAPTPSKPTNSSPTPRSNHNNAGKIAGGIIGGLCVVVLIIMASIWLLRRRRRHLTQPSPDSLSLPPRDSAFMSDQTTTQWSATNSLGHAMMVQSTTHLDGSRFVLFDDPPVVGHDSRTFLNINLPASNPSQANRRSWDQISAESGEHMIVMAQTTEDPDMSMPVPPREEAQKAFASSSVDAVVADIIQTMNNRKGRTSG